MTNKLSLISRTFRTHLIRYAIEENNKPLFVAKDICETLGYTNPRDAIKRHCKGVVKHDTPTSGGVQSVTYINEADVYRLILRSKLPDVETFQDWVCEDVLPSIRETGSYGVKGGSHVVVETTGDQFRDFMKAMEMMYNQSLEVAEKTRALDRRAAQIERKAKAVDKQIADIAAGSVPAGWNTIGELGRQTGLTNNKVSEIIAAYEVQKKKIAQASDQRITHVTVASESQFYAAFQRVKSESEKLSGQYYRHDILGRFAIKTKAA